MPHIIESELHLFDIGWTELMVVAVVAIIVVGPKDLPKMLRTFGRTMKSIRGMAGEFQKQFEDAVKEADLDDVKNIASGKGFKPLEDIKESSDAFKKEMEARWSEGTNVATKEEVAEKLPEPRAKAPKKVAKSTGKSSAKSTTAKSTARKTGTSTKSTKTAAVRKSATKTATRKKPAGKTETGKSA